MEKDEQTPKTTPKENSETLVGKTTNLVNPYEPPIPFPQLLRKLHINIPFAEALFKMSGYTKFLKDIISKKRKLEDHETVILTEECSAIIQKKLPPKLKDPGSFTILCTIGEFYFDKALCDLGASINLMPLSAFRKLELGETKATMVTLQLADRSLAHPMGLIENILIKVDKFIFLVDFLILDMKEDKNIPLILGRPFLSTSRALIDVQKGQLNLRFGEEHITFNVFNAMDYHVESDSCYQINMVKEVMQDKIVFQNFSNTTDDHNVHIQPKQNHEKQEVYIVEFEAVDEGKTDDTNKDKTKFCERCSKKEKVIKEANQNF